MIYMRTLMNMTYYNLTVSQVYNTVVWVYIAMRMMYYCCSL